MPRHGIGHNFQIWRNFIRGNAMSEGGIWYYYSRWHMVLLQWILGTFLPSHQLEEQLQMVPTPEGGIASRTAEQRNIEEIEGKLGIMLDTIKETTRLSLDMLKECKRNTGSVLSVQVFWIINLNLDGHCWKLFE